MARPTSIDNETILDAARALFLDKGWTASTAAIAKAAGVSEGTLFKRFGTKFRLFQAAMGMKDVDVELSFGSLVGQNSIRENLETIGERLVAFFRDLLPRMQRVCGHPGFDPAEFMRSEEDPPPLRAIRNLSHYIGAEIKLGRLRPCDSEVIARVLLGSVHAYVFHEQVGLNEKLPLAAPTYIRGLVDALLNGIKPAGPEPQGK
ncbi:MAG: AcrR family transcriptional regulator [Myxococcota bacterium]|jgi:AcrR family transcriptional regulator